MAGNAPRQSSRVLLNIFIFNLSRRLMIAMIAPFLKNGGKWRRMSIRGHGIC